MWWNLEDTVYVASVNNLFIHQCKINIRADSRATLYEELPEAYTDVTEVVDIVEHAGISQKIVQLKPLCVIKG